MKIIISLLISMFALSSFAQTESDKEILQQFFQQRKQMMEEVMKAFDDDAFDDDAFFNKDFFDDDQLFDSLKKKGFGNIDRFSQKGNNVKVQERIEKDGSISIVITPANKHLKLDINTTKDSIKIKSEMMFVESKKSKSQSLRSSSRSTSSQTIRIPFGYIALDPTQEGKSIKISLIPKSKKYVKPNKDGQVPIQKRRGEKTI